MPTPTPADLHDASGPPPACLTIAGSDPSGGAGLQADLKSFAAMGVYGMSALTVATDCETQTGVEEVHALPPAFVRRQVDRVCADITPAAVKTGMLFEEEIIRTVAEAARAHGVSQDGSTPLVVDPVMTTRRGERLLSDGAEAALVEALLPLATVVTPSLPEAERLVGRTVRTRKAMRQAAEALLDLGAGAGPAAVIITGGHLDADTKAADLLFDADGMVWLEAKRVPRTLRGAGDAFSAALAAGLARGLDLRAAADRAKTFVTGAIREAPERGRGDRPLWHGWFGTVPFETECEPDTLRNMEPPAARPRS